MSSVNGASRIDARRRVAVVEGGRVDERLERRAGLAHRLGGAVELALVEGEAADHGVDAARIGIHRHDGAGDLGHLAQTVLARLALERLDIDHVAGRQRPLDRPARPFGAVGRDEARLPVANHLAGRFPLRLQADRAPARLRPRAPRRGARAARRRAAGTSARARPHSRPARSIFCCAPRQPRASSKRTRPSTSALRAMACIFGSRVARIEQPALVERLLAVALGDLAAHLLGEVAGRDAVRRHVRAD